MNGDHYLAAMSHMNRPDPPADHELMTLDGLTSLAFDAELTVEYPPPGGPGWATTRLGSHRWAAWYVPEVIA